MIAFLRNLVVKDFWLKLFSLALAVLIWLTVSFAIHNQVSSVAPLKLPPAERTFFNLPVVVMSSAEDVRNFKVSPNEVEVLVQGEAGTLKTLQSKDIRVMVDLSGIAAGENLTKRIEVSTPAGVTHVRVDPPQVRVLFPRKS